MVITKILPLCLCAVFLMNSDICNENNNFVYKYAANGEIPNNLIDTRLIRVTEDLRKYAEEQSEEKKRMEKERKKHVCFNSYDIGIPSGITYEEMAKVLKSSHYANVLKFSNAFVDAEKQYKVNAFALAAISGAESGWNESRRANNGNNNITGMDVKSDSSKGTVYASKYDCIMDLARQLRTYYLTPGACYYSGVSTSKVNKYYSADSKWYKTIDKIGDELVFEYDRLYRQ